MQNEPLLFSAPIQATPPEPQNHNMQDAAACAGVGALLSLGSYALHCGAGNGGSFDPVLHTMSSIARFGGIVSWGIGLAKVGSELGVRLLESIESHRDNPKWKQDNVNEAKSIFGMGLLAVTSIHLGQWGLQHADTTPSLPSITSGTLVGVGMVAALNSLPSVLSIVTKHYSGLLSAQQPTSTLSDSPHADYQGQVQQATQSIIR